MLYCSHLVTDVALLIHAGLGSASERHSAECSLLSGIGSIPVLCAAVGYSCGCHVCDVFCVHQTLYLSGSRCVNIVNAAQSF